MKKIEKLERKHEGYTDATEIKMNEIIDVLNEFIEIKPSSEVSENAEKANPYPNLSKLVGVWDEDLAIMGEKMLISLSNGELSYHDYYRDLYKPVTNFKETTLGELEVGDVFVFNVSGDVDCISVVFILIGIKASCFKTQSIMSYGMGEYIDNDEWDIREGENKVIKFLREE